MAGLSSQTLLAKKPCREDDIRKEETLAGHTCAVIRAAEAIFESIEESIRETFALSRCDTAFLKKCVQRAALLHDLGKANHQFQTLMYGREQKQALRHEWISAWLPLWDNGFSSWLFEGDDTTLRDVAVCAVLGHHLKADNACSLDVRPGSGDNRLQCYFKNVKKCLEEAGAHMGLSGSVPDMRDTEIDLTDHPLKELRKWFLDDLDRKEIVPIAKALLMAADVAGSALPVRQDMDISKWIGETLGRRCTTDGVKEIVKRRLGNHRPRKFQCQVKDTPHRATLVRAGCGSGKTVAAYTWAAERAEGRKLFICYPTTGTATEGYRDYIITSDMREESALLHSRSEVDIKRILEAEPELLGHNPGLGITALVSWDVPITVCTADTVLGIIQNSRRPLYSSPAFMNAAFVFDEIHQYDSRMWGALIRFLEMFKGAPVLLMTASLPEGRRKGLEKSLHNELAVIEGPAEHERIPRYQLRCQLTGSGSSPWRAAKAVLGRSGKVLWVCNTVSRCVEAGKEAGKSLGGVRIIPYHSRYRYCDRLDRHNEVIGAFRDDEPVLAVTTQVCEVSLDISADLLITDLAPIPSLIQRLGRLNRRATAQSPPCDAVLLKPPSHLPYEERDLKDAASWVECLTGRPVSQRDLARAFNSIAEKQEILKTSSEWIDGGKFSRQAPLRDAGYTIPVVREEDVEQAGKPLTREFVVHHEIPMPLAEVAGEIGRWKRIRHAWIAPRGRVDYDEEKWGATWAKQQSRNPGR